MNPLHSLLEEIASPTTSPQRRSDVGLALSILGDPRLGVGLRADGLPDVVWCEAERNHDSARTFYIAKYPITHVQFKAFFDAPDGYANDGWWAGLSFGKQIWKNTAEALNAPADNVAWVNAVAFCRWLNAKVTSAALLPDRRDDYEIRLPTETEWTKAALGGQPEDGYPWGADWIPTGANSRETELRKSVSVGLFPNGAAPCGALDMVGNTWEWCLNDVDHASQTDVGGVERRIMCGGSYLDAPSSLRCNSRLNQHPLSRNNTSSFRIAYASRRA